jgi:hypothetical protein
MFINEPLAGSLVHSLPFFQIGNVNPTWRRVEMASRLNEKEIKASGSRKMPLKTVESIPYDRVSSDGTTIFM